MQTIQCQNCNHVWNTPFFKHCKCPACGVQVQIPGALHYYQRNRSLASTMPGAVRGAPINAGAPVRDNEGQPLPPPATTHERGEDKPKYVADDYSFIRRRQEQLKQEAQARVAGEDKF